MTHLPMEVDLDFKWEVTGEKLKKECEYLSPLAKRRLDLKKDDHLDCTEIVKYVHKKRNVEDTGKNVCVSNVVKATGVNSIVKALLSLPRNFFYYLVFVFDAVFMLIFLYAFLQLFFFIQKDLMHKIKEKATELEQIVEMAKHNYLINKCDRSTRVPALESVCNKWECTINNGSIEYTKVFFEVFGEVIDGFIRKFSVRSTIVVGVFMVIYLKYRNGK